MSELREQLRKHLKNFTTEEVRSEISIIRQKFQSKRIKTRRT